MEIKTIFVVGAGLMGSGIAQVAADAGYQVILNDVSSEAVQKGINAITKNLDRSVQKGRKTSEEKDTILARITSSTSLEDAKPADLVIEAIFENAELKMEIFKKLESICKPECIFATNTSSIPISQLAVAVSKPDKFIGMHFFSPVPVMKLVELISGLKTSEETLRTIEEVAAKMKKETVRVKDVPGFLVNRINNALRLEAYRCLDEGVATIEDIDKALKMGLNHPMGPFELADFVGLDVGLNVAKTLYEGYKDPKWRPSLTLQKLVLSGDLGRKTGKGWYDYSSGEKKPRNDVNF